MECATIHAEKHRLRRWNVALKIQPHGRLQEWVADELGYFTDEGLEYTFVTGDLAQHRDASGQIKSGAYESYEAGREADVSCACHWAVNTAAMNQIGKMVGSVYSVTPCAIVVPPESGIVRPEDLAGVPVAVGFHSGSHFTTLQALEDVLASEEITLSFEGSPATRLDSVLERAVPAATVFGVQLYIAQAMGFRTVLDTSFMIGFLANDADVDPSDIEKYVEGLKRAQMEIDLRAERYKHYHLKSVPEKYRERVDVRQFGAGERVVFLPYTAEAYGTTQMWIQERRIFDEAPGLPLYDKVVLV
jgi:NitT/TauT family transport system substrate-binding protein